MTLDNNTGTVISLEEAKGYTHAFQEDKPDAIKSFYVGAKKLQRILEQEDCMGVRIYNGRTIDTDYRNKANLVLVGVNKKGEDMTDGIILEDLAPCPHFCPQSSPLIKL